MQTITVEVTAEDIRAAREGGWRSNTLIRSCISKKLLCEQVLVREDRVMGEIIFSRHTPFPPKREWVPAPIGVLASMAHFDREGVFAPFTFDLEIPDWVQLRQ